jgi:hypothetical protein
MFKRSIPRAAALLAAALSAACGGEPPAADDQAVVEMVSPVPAEPSATAIVRREPTVTPTPEPDPMSVVFTDLLPGVPIPYSAQLVLSDIGHEGAGEGTESAGIDTLVEYSVSDADAATLREWFLEHMPAAGWDEGEERDGALLFRHLEERAARASGEDPMRTATIFFDLRDGVSFSVLAELAAASGEAPTATPSQG